MNDLNFNNPPRRRTGSIEKRATRSSLGTLIILLLSSLIGLSQAPGSLDASFGTDGRVLTDFGSAENASGVACQPDGKVVVVGGTGPVGVGTNRNFALARYNSNGSLDQSFGVNGRVVTDFLGYLDGANAVIIASDGKILVCGVAYSDAAEQTSVFAMARYNSDGSLDLSFDGDGKATTSFAGGSQTATDLVLQPDGKLVVVGGETYGHGAALARYNPDGSLDAAFGAEGKVFVSLRGGGGIAEAVALQGDGKIIIGGTTQALGFMSKDFAIARFTVSGVLDSSFGTGGITLTDISGGDEDSVQDVALQEDGKIVAAGYARYDPSGFAVARYNANGFLDNSFGSNGKVVTYFGTFRGRLHSVDIQSDAKIVTGGSISSQSGSVYDFALARYQTNGDPDNGFGSSGIVTTDFNGGQDIAFAIDLQSDGKIVAAGARYDVEGADFALSRYLAAPVSVNRHFDYDGDGKSDISVFRPTSGDWYLQRSTAGFYGQNFGSSQDRIAPADYDGDGKTDIAVYRPSTGIWYITNSTTGAVTYNVFGIAEDLPTPADYDGDGKADISVFRPSSGTWYRQNSSNGSFVAFQFGATGDKPTVGDFDGDGKSDIAVFRPSTGAWYQTWSSSGFLFGEQFGVSTDKITQADYDGDGKTDIAIYRPSEGLWYVKRSATTTYVPYVFGLAADIPTPGDFDGDGKADIGVFRPSDGTWYIVNSSNGSYTIQQFGQNGDQPTESAFGN